MVDMVLNKLKLCVKRFKLLKLAFKFNIYYNLRQVMQLLLCNVEWNNENYS